MVIKENTVCYFIAICRIKNIYGTCDFLLTHDHMWLEISKRYSYSFHLISAHPKLYEDIVDNGGIQAFLVIGQVLKKSVAFLNFNMGGGVNRKILKCEVS